MLIIFFFLSTVWVELAFTRGAIVNLPGSRIQGMALGGSEAFNGIPFAESPAGKNRLRRPVRRTEGLGDFDAARKSPLCHDGYYEPNPSDYPWHKDHLEHSYTERYNVSTTEDAPVRNYLSTEDCLTISVTRPAGTKAGDKLPVMFMIHGYGFVVGSPEPYDRDTFLQFGVDNHHPFIFVTANYRVGAWGFLPGNESIYGDATNLGLYDQRMAMEWTSDNIEAFGGDPDKITLFGHAAGGVSAFAHLVINDGNITYNGRELFHGVVMSSGSLMPANAADSSRAQLVYDSISAAAGCDIAMESLKCLRDLSDLDFWVASNSIPGINAVEALRLLYIPRPDGKLLRDSPEELIKQGKFAQVPIIIGNQEDEAALFTLEHGLFENKAGHQLWGYLRDYYFNQFTRDNETALREWTYLYSALPEDGSPFRTGEYFETWFGRKLVTATMGDIFFNFPRRIAMQLIAEAAPSVPMWGYTDSHNHGDLAIYEGLVGTTHGSFLDSVFAQGEWATLPSSYSTRAHLINFMYSLNPNKGIESIESGEGGEVLPGLAHWPQWTMDMPRLLWINRKHNAYVQDGERKKIFEEIKNNVAWIRL
ncbi:alpha/beta-hydrolase [Trichoderma citrinoviride]|uniref:Alpha/beta-hydrolase n=1 Tax=Trichoderma citrinoviride TaxID=58853 RepID=A0A2T4BJY9_9HYPO|nr:alpha/beta-hydrolase [Trichoderma citrinoviride]PTB69642.1 alpha/beta-hydrolase [Trichoderma citrinoviride]